MPNAGQWTRSGGLLGPRLCNSSPNADVERLETPRAGSDTHYCEVTPFHEEPDPLYGQWRIVHEIRHALSVFKKTAAIRWLDRNQYQSAAKQRVPPNWDSTDARYVLTKLGPAH